jgi:DNA invertase Pin-like site-specific DNA recombinase
MHILAAIAEFERARIAERVRAGLARVKARGQRLGRRPRRVSDRDLENVAKLSVRKLGKMSHQAS